ncbi:MAG: chemotaxis protein CheX [Acidobacteriota bacterium]|nr:chemotaxis protein CheX [Acidobacteriota bacterium]
MLAVLTRVTKEVFETMVFAPVEALPPCDTLPPASGPGVIGTISFAGSSSGVVSFAASLESAREIAGGMLGMSPAEVQDELPDAVGEITNMIAGSFRTQMADEAGAWTISTPNVTIGSDLSVRHVGAVARTVCPFVFRGHRIFVELVLTDPTRLPHAERQEARAC